MKKVLLGLILLTPFFSFCQINVADSTVQVITYWDKHEKMTYDIATSKATVKGNDTTYTQKVKFKVDIEVLDSTATSYTIQWKFKDYASLLPDESAEIQANLYNGLTIEFTTDELGTFDKLLNWKEIKEHNERVFSELKGKTNSQEVLVKMLRQKFSSQQAIEEHSIKEVQYFHSFHGVGMKEGEVVEENVSRDTFIGKSVQSDITLELTEIDYENSTYIIKYWEDFEGEGVVNLIGSMFPNYKEKIENSIGDDMSLNDFMGANMHESGWPLYLVYERTLSFNENHMYFEQCTISLEE